MPSQNGVIVFDVDAFRTAFPAFANVSSFSDETLSGYWNAATYQISDRDYGWLNGAARDRALNCLTAHLTQLSVLVQSGQTVGLVNGAQIDKVQVTLTPPPVKSQWQWWMSLTPYGAEALAILSAKGVGGIFVGGSPNGRAFRGFGGVW